jgi:hypothetical protein
MKSSPETSNIISTSFQNLKATQHKGLICINYSLKQVPICVNYFHDFNLFTKQLPKNPFITKNDTYNNNIVPFHKKTNYNSNEFFNNILQNVSSSPDNPIMLIFSNDIEDFVKYVQTGKDLLNKIHYTRVKRLSLYYKKNLQNKEKIDEMILKLSTLLNEKKEIIKVRNN